MPAVVVCLGRAWRRAALDGAQRTDRFSIHATAHSGVFGNGPSTNHLSRSRGRLLSPGVAIRHSRRIAGQRSAVCLGQLVFVFGRDPVLAGFLVALRQGLRHCACAERKPDRRRDHVEVEFVHFRSFRSGVGKIRLRQAGLADITLRQAHAVGPDGPTLRNAPFAVCLLSHIGQVRRLYWKRTEHPARPAGGFVQSRLTIRKSPMPHRSRV